MAGACALSDAALATARNAPGMVLEVDAAYHRVLELVAERYAPPLYEPADGGEPDVVVTLGAPGARPLYVKDAPRHDTLRSALEAGLGKDGVRMAPVAADAVVTLSEARCFRVRPRGQLAHFAQFKAELPSWVAKHFPIRTPDGSHRLHAKDIAVVPEGSPLSSRWLVKAHLRLERIAGAEDVSDGTFVIANFFGPKDDGRTLEPGQDHGRPFDEVAPRFRENIGRWLTQRLGADVQAVVESGQPNLGALFASD